MTIFIYSVASIAPIEWLLHILKFSTTEYDHQSILCKKLLNKFILISMPNFYL